MRFLDTFRHALRREPEARAGELLANDGYFGVFLLGVAVVAALTGDLPPSIQLATAGLAMVGAPVAVAIRPGLSDRVLVAMGAVLAGAALFSMGSAIHYLVTNPTGGFRYGPGLGVWILYHATLHWVATGTRRPWVRRLPSAALIIGIAGELWILYLVIPRFADAIAHIFSLTAH